MDEILLKLKQLAMQAETDKANEIEGLVNPRQIEQNLLSNLVQVQVEISIIQSNIARLDAMRASYLQIIDDIESGRLGE